jgi:hypothetical protein
VKGQFETKDDRATIRQTYLPVRGNFYNCQAISIVRRPEKERSMARHAGGGKAIVESCPSIDVLDLHRRGYLQSAQCFSLAWTCDGELMASIYVRTESHCVTLHYSSVSHDAFLSNVEQRVAIVWTPCHFGGQRPFFLCSFDAKGAQCGRQVSKLYGGGRLFACRHCYRLAYASQRETVSQRGRRKAQKIRMRLGGGSPSMTNDFPARPRGMHEQTFERWRRIHDAAEECSTNGLIRFVERLGRRISRRAS